MNGHPNDVHLPEAAVLEPSGKWLDRLFAPRNQDRTVAALVASQRKITAASTAQDAARKRLESAEARLKRFQAAIEAGLEPAALVEAINEAQARAELNGTSAPDGTKDAEVHAMLDALGNVGTIISRGNPEKLEDLFAGLGLEMLYNVEGRTVEVTIRPVGRVSARVREVCPNTHPWEISHSS